MMEQNDATSELQDLKRQIAMLEHQNVFLKKENEYLAFCLEETRKSFTYRLGRAITYIPRTLKERRVKRVNADVVSDQQTGSYDAEVTEFGSVVIRHNTGEENTLEYWEIPLEHIFWGGRIAIPMTVENGAKERILWIHKMTDQEFGMTGECMAKGPAQGILCLYTNSLDRELYLILFTTMEQIYKRFVHMKLKRAAAVLRKKYLSISFDAAIYSLKTSDLKMEKAELVVDDNHRYPLNLEITTEAKNYERISIKIPLESIASQETQINNPFHVEVTIKGVTISFNIGRKKKIKKPTKFYYVPTSARYYEGFALFIRKNVNQNYTLVVRKMENCEKERSFQFLESRPISGLLYYTGKLARLVHRRNVNLYFEKNSGKAEEGTYQLFELAAQSKRTRNYYILDNNTPLWEKLSSNKNVVAKYSLKYYWLLYTSDYFISTETSSHLNVHRALNRYVRTALLERPLIFLQHGVTYLKRQGEGSVFGKGKEGEPLYMAVGSEKEQRIVCDMLKLEPEQCILTGLPIFSTISYGHIRANSRDIVTIMFTWQPSEEHLGDHFEDSSYYKKTRRVYDLLKQFAGENEIRIVPHPKVLSLLMETDFREQIWTGSVAEVLQETKLLITDYSSVCYNAFYQGAAVIFYQPDLEAYEKEVGKLIPQEDEYIGQRVFEIDALEQVLKNGIEDGRILLEALRTEEHCRRYREINAFSDGKNVERIFEFLVGKGIV